jgi:uncharacterized protein (TIGR00730 family)
MFGLNASTVLWPGVDASNPAIIPSQPLSVRIARSSPIKTTSGRAQLPWSDSAAHSSPILHMSSTGGEAVNAMLKRVCVFCGSSVGHAPEFREGAEILGRELARRGIGLVFGGGCVGLMGVIADAVLAAGGHAIGVIPHAMVSRELAHHGLPDLRVVNSMHERKSMMADLSDAFIALPGGFGTFEEFCEAVTWTQLGLHQKRCGLLNIGGYYDPLLALFDRAVDVGFVSRANRAIVLAEDDPGRLLEGLAMPVAARKQWLRTSEEA